jgi:hypothetical protein
MGWDGMGGWMGWVWEEWRVYDTYGNWFFGLGFSLFEFRVWEGEVGCGIIHV